MRSFQCLLSAFGWALLALVTAGSADANPILTGSTNTWLEAECAHVGSNWSKVLDPTASGGAYLHAPSGNFTSAPSGDTANSVLFVFEVPTAGQYSVFGRITAPSTNDDSYWVRANGGTWVRWNLIEPGAAFHWDQVHNDQNNSQPVLFSLTPGVNTIEFHGRENGTSLDKVFVTLTGSTPTGLGDPGMNCLAGAPILVNPLTAQASGEGDAISLQIFASGGDGPLNYAATGLPPGLSVNAATGLITGQVSAGAANGSPYSVTVIIDDADSISADQIAVGCTWIVFPPGGAFTDIWLDIENQISPKHIPRHENSFVQAGNRFYLFGGRESPKTVEAFDYINKSWSVATTSTPLEFNHFQPVEYQGFIWVMGAFKNNSYPSETPADSIYLFDPVLKTWRSWMTIPNARKRGSTGTVMYKDKFYVVGGNTIGHNGGYVSWFDVFDPLTNTWTPLPNAPTERDHFQAVVIGDKLYVAGGRKSGGPGGTFAPMITQVDVYNFLTNSWTTLPSSSNLPTPRAGTASVNFKGKLFVIGGEGNGQAWPTTEMLDVNTGNWSTMDDLNHARHGTQAVAAGEGIYITSGSFQQGGGKMTNMEVYNMDIPGNASPIVASALHVVDSVAVFGAGAGTSVIRLVNAGLNQGIILSGLTLSGNQFQLGQSFNFPYLLRVGDTLEVPVIYTPNGSPFGGGLQVIHSGTNGPTLVPFQQGQSTSQPILVNPVAAQLNLEGDAVSLQVVASGGDGALHYSAQGLPTGLSIGTSSGLISGTIAGGTAASSPYSVVITVDDADSTNADAVIVALAWTVSVIPPQSPDFWLEAECAVVGSAWGQVQDGNASNGIYLTSPASDFMNAPSGDTANSVLFQVDIPVAGVYKVFGRVIAPSTNDDSYWVRANGGTWYRWNLIEPGNTLHWDQVHNDQNNSQPVLFSLNQGMNTIEFGGRENGASLDKIFVTLSGTTPAGAGDPASNCTVSTEIPIAVAPVANQNHQVGDAVQLQVQATGGDSTLVYQAMGLPAGLSIQASSGIISGTLTGNSVGSFSVTVTVDDSDANASDQKSVSFLWTVIDTVMSVQDVWLEVECGVVGTNWMTQADAAVSNGAYLESPNNQFLGSPSNNVANIVRLPFSVTSAGTYHVFGRVLAPNSNDDSFWIRMNGGNWIRWNEIEHSSSWIWDQVHDNQNGNQLVNFSLVAGTNVLEIGARESGTRIDKLFVTPDQTPKELGGESVNCQGITGSQASDAAPAESLAGALTPLSIYPNPIDASKQSLTIDFGRLMAESVRYSVSDISGRLIVSGEWEFDQTPGQQESIQLPALPSGLYLLRLQGDSFLHVHKVKVMAE